MIILKLNENFEILEYIPIENYFGNHAIPGVLEYFDDDTFILASSAFSLQRYFDRYDSLVTVSKYNRKGDIISAISFLPESYTKNKIGYDLLYYPIVSKINNELIILYQLDNNVYNENGIIKHSLDNLPYSNDKGLELYSEYKKLIKSRNESRDEELLKRLFPVVITNSFISNGNLNIIYIVYDGHKSTMGFYYLIQEYNMEGQLLTQTEFYDDPNNSIRHFIYDEVNQLLLLFRKSNTGWSMERIKW